MSLSPRLHTKALRNGNTRLRGELATLLRQVAEQNVAVRQAVLNREAAEARAKAATAELEQLRLHYNILALVSTVLARKVTP